MGQNYVAIEGGTAASRQRWIPGGTPLKTREQPDFSAHHGQTGGRRRRRRGRSPKASARRTSAPSSGPITDFIKQNSAPAHRHHRQHARPFPTTSPQGKGTVGKLINDDAFYSAAYTTVTNLQAASADIKGVIGQGRGHDHQSQRLALNRSTPAKALSANSPPTKPSTTRPPPP